ncbi:MAG: hypothetical protein U0802_24325 [Candidatus Binatia bacterium]
MGDRPVSVRRTAQVMAVAAVAMLSAVAPSRALQATSACCFAAGNCQDLLPSVCSNGGGSPVLAGSCATVSCPVLCSAAGPECNGQCPTGTTCVNPSPGGATTSALSLCQCVPEIPEGGACAAQPDACAPGLSCQNGICALAPSPAPLLSPGGMVVALATLLGLAGSALRRRR